MPKLSALIYTRNDAQRIGRLLDSLRPCSEVVVIDDNSEDDTARIAQEHGAIVKKCIPGVTPGAYTMEAQNCWILCVKPSEALSEALEASLLEWRDDNKADENPGYNLRLRVQENGAWKELAPETRLVNRDKINWTGDLPPTSSVLDQLEGDLLRFSSP
jgi:glycosyltransferase involved in cell wall biosynthesis